MPRETALGRPGGEAAVRTDGGDRSRLSAPGFEGWSGGATPDSTDATYTRTHEWTYLDETLRWDLEIPVSTYEYCTNRARTGQYGLYIADPFQRPFVGSIAERLSDHCRGLTRGDRLTAATRFVQCLEYSLDVEDTGHEAYPKYPIETLVHRRGDCEDGTILLGTILREMGYDIAVLVLPEARHMVLGVAGDDFSGANVTHEGTDYYVLETTDVGWDVGEFPPEYANASVRPHDPDESPVLVHQWEATPRDARTVDVDVHVANYGDAGAEDLSVQIEFERRDGERIAAGQLRGGSSRLEPGDSTTYEGSLRLEPKREVRGRCRLGLGRMLHDESESDWR